MPPFRVTWIKSELTKKAVTNSSVFCCISKDRLFGPEANCKLAQMSFKLFFLLLNWKDNHPEGTLLIKTETVQCCHDKSVLVTPISQRHLCGPPRLRTRSKQLHSTSNTKLNIWKVWVNNGMFSSTQLENCMCSEVIYHMWSYDRGQSEEEWNSNFCCLSHPAARSVWHVWWMVLPWYCCPLTSAHCHRSGDKEEKHPAAQAVDAAFHQHKNTDTWKRSTAPLLPL